jgi:hypothetical protein
MAWKRLKDELNKDLDKLCDTFYAGQIDEIEFQKKAAELAIQWATKETGMFAAKSKDDPMTELFNDFFGYGKGSVEVAGDWEPAPVLVDIVERKQEERKP